MRYGGAFTEGCFYAIHGYNIKSYMRCRVELAWEWTSDKDTFIGFRKTGLNVKSVREFWAHIESRLGHRAAITIHDMTPVHLYGKDMIIIELPMFWRRNSTVRSLFSLLLRCSAVYYKGNFDEAINSYALARKVKDAINLFLSGRIKPTYKRLRRMDEEGYTGFVAEFQGLTNEEICAKLIKS